MAKRKAVVMQQACVACGTCVKVCPLQTISIYKGMFAEIGPKCVGCGKCAAACPASVITIKSVEEVQA